MNYTINLVMIQMIKTSNIWKLKISLLKYPIILSISSPNKSILVYGNNFISSSQCIFNGKFIINSYFINSTIIKCIYPSTKIVNIFNHHQLSCIWSEDQYNLAQYVSSTNIICKIPPFLKKEEESLSPSLLIYH